MVKGSQEIKDIEVKPGDKLWDIPLPPFGRTLKTAAATGLGVAIGAVGGVFTTVGTTLRTAWDGVKNAFQEPSPSTALAAVAGLAGAPVTGVIDGVHKALHAPIKAAEAAWKKDSFVEGVKSAASFDSEVSALANGAGGLVGGATAAIPAAVTTAVATTAVELGRGLKTAVTSDELNLPGRVLTAAGSLLSAPTAGVVHAATTGIATPFAAAGHAWDKKSSAEGLAKGISGSHDVTKHLSGGAGAAVAGLAIGTVSAVASTASSAVREIGGGLVDAATNSELNVKGKVLDAVGGIPGDAVSAIGQGLGTFVMTPVRAASSGFENKKASDGVAKAADFGVKSIHASIRPEGAMVEQVEVPAE